MLAGQEQERLDLRAAHRQETSALTRQQIAERLGVHEKWRALGLGRQANRIDARLTAKQGMAAQQKAALDTIKLHARTGQGAAASSNPREAARAHFETAKAEEAKYDAIRQKLLEDRTKNLERAGAAADKSHDQSAQKQRPASRRAVNGGATGKASPRDSIAPGIHAAKDSGFAKIQERLRDIDPQQQIRQAKDGANSRQQDNGKGGRNGGGRGR